uniref:Fucolectin tachylectin-4 pentraxin-1 domain-containing protein n=1 Tax=Leptobrachium leishanense TaxID=445787 RepID=A0A8C5N3H1_9ANUR
MRAWLLLVVSLYGLSMVRAVCFLLPNDQNVALHRPACQSSLYANAGPKRAVDGNKDSDYGKGSCSHTLYDFPAWWRVDLAERYKISMVKVVNRADCCRERLAGAEVWIGDSDDYQKNVLCGKILDTTSPCVRWRCLAFRKKTELSASEMLCNRLHRLPAQIKNM